MLSTKKTINKAIDEVSYFLYYITIENKNTQDQTVLKVYSNSEKSARESVERLLARDERYSGYEIKEIAVL